MKNVILPLANESNLNLKYAVLVCPILGNKYVVWLESAVMESEKCSSKTKTCSRFRRRRRTKGLYLSLIHICKDTNSLEVSKAESLGEILRT